MQVIFIRHGEPDPEPADRRGFIGMGRDMAPLTALGREQARRAAEDPRLAGAQLILPPLIPGRCKRRRKYPAEPAWKSRWRWICTK